MNIIYLDNAATTPVDPDVLDYMAEISKIYYANPSSIHTSGQQARELIEKARYAVAGAISANANEIVFTSGGTESNNLAIIGTALTYQNRGNHIIVSRIEHSSILESCQYLEKLGFHISYVDVDENGQLNLDQLKYLIRKETLLVSIMLVNNETGSILPIKAAAEIVKNRDILLHTDAVQALDKIEIAVDELQTDLLTLSAHKIFGPKGIGALYVRRGTEINPILHGGNQETGRRAGTENIAGIAGFARAIEKMAKYADKQIIIAKLKELLETELKKRIPGIAINAEKSDRIAHISNIYFPFMSGDSLVINLDLNGIAASTGSACTSGSHTASHVLTAMGYENKRVHNSIRFSLSRYTAETAINKTIKVLSDIYRKNNY